MRIKVFEPGGLSVTAVLLAVIAAVLLTAGACGEKGSGTGNDGTVPDGQVSREAVMERPGRGFWLSALLGGTVEKESVTEPPAVAIVIDDAGIRTDKLQTWLSIDAPLCFSVMPHYDYSYLQAEVFHRCGYVVMMHIPTQNQPPNSYSGPGQLSVGMDHSTVYSTLDGDLTTIPHVEGINNHQGGLGCDDLQLMTLECEWARGKELFVVDSSSSANSRVSQACLDLGMDKRKNQVFIDHHNDPEYLRSAMRELADIARSKGAAIGICHLTRPFTADVVKEMVDVLRSEGINFAFARDITN